LERQRDPSNPAHLAGPDGAISNRTGMSWTVAGDLSSPSRLLVDPRGFLSIPGAGWGLDWWIGGDDRWHIPAREPAVRQALLEETPVVVTTVRVPSGDVHQRVMVLPGPGGSEAVVEITNDSAAPVAIALAARPITLQGVGSLRRVELRDTTLRLDGADALILPERPRRMLLSRGCDPDPLRTVTEGGAPEAGDAQMECPEGRAGAVLVVPLAHRAVWRYRIALDAPPPAPRRRWPRPRNGAVSEAAAPTGTARTTPSPEAVARGWRTQIDRVRLELPDDRVTAVLGALRGHLLIAAGDRPVGSAGAEVAVAAATAGYATAGSSALLDAALTDATDPEIVGSALWAAGQLVGLGVQRPRGVVVAVAAEQLARAGSAARSAVAPAWVAAGLAAAAPLLLAAGEERAASQAGQWAQAAAARLMALPAGDDARLLAAALVGVAPPPSGAASGGPAVPPTGALARTEGGAVDLPRSLLWAGAALAAGDPGWHERVGAVVAAGGPTAAWPDLVDLTHGGGCGSDGHSPLVTARLWSVVRGALIAEHSGGLALLPGWPPAWIGQGLEVHGLPTQWGLVSFALRWHGARPALLWSVDGAPALVTITAPALAPGWSASDSEGEALFAPPDTSSAGPVGSVPR
jgi:hypothetical protein